MVCARKLITKSHCTLDSKNITDFKSDYPSGSHHSMSLALYTCLRHEVGKEEESGGDLRPPPMVPQRKDCLGKHVSSTLTLDLIYITENCHCYVPSITGSQV